ncbi:MAG TPA: FtsX-like permease family protein [Ignavibacteria bacterium]|nr:FtsX-like permease family protein [Ignavibacteria bacterium]
MLISESFSVSLHSIKSNKLRAGLTIFGIAVGVFSIIVIMTIITMMQGTIQSGVSFLSKNTFQIQKYPAIQIGGHRARRKYRNRKDITLDDFYRLQSMLKTAKYMGAQQIRGGRVIQFKNKKTNPNIYIVGITEGVMKTSNIIVGEGRSINKNDIKYSKDVCLLGQDVQTKLFAGIDPLGQTIKVDNHNLRIIGIIEKQPEFFGQSMDNYIITPITSYQSFYGKNKGSVEITIMSNSKEDYDATIQNAIGHLRTIRKVEPGKANDFDIFSNESLIGQINNITGGVRIGAMVISLIALLAAGIGIMNIMLVSVTERTKEIGIRKAVGATKTNILMQFLIEAIILSLFGGFIGIVFGVGLGNFVGSFLNAKTAIPYDWVGIGLSLCVLIGVIFGTYPAYKASNLDPIEALRYE